MTPAVRELVVLIALALAFLAGRLTASPPVVLGDSPAVTQELAHVRALERLEAERRLAASSPPTVIQQLALPKCRTTTSFGPWDSHAAFFTRPCEP